MKFDTFKGLLSPTLRRAFRPSAMHLKTHQKSVREIAHAHDFLACLPVASVNVARSMVMSIHKIPRSAQ